ncbi:MAG: hypothetical protein HYV33_06450 [Candidatus Kerfeldbacteria bacterium]|nr:hypothetical protein [Candidatus Kerfeldbacteria bacterium]
MLFDQLIQQFHEYGVPVSARIEHTAQLRNYDHGYTDAHWLDLAALLRQVETERDAMQFVSRMVAHGASVAIISHHAA